MVKLCSGLSSGLRDLHSLVFQGVSRSALAQRFIVKSLCPHGARLKIVSGPIASRPARDRTSHTVQHPMANIFISYRREDSSGFAGRIYDRLSALFGEEHIFMDVDTIEPGLDFVDAIEAAVGSCDALIAVIGRRWFGPEGENRLQDPEDLVRVEVAAALERKIRVIPVLIEGAQMPKATDLPGPLKPLSRRHSVTISHARFKRDVEALIETVEKVLEQRAASREPSAGKIRGVKAVKFHSDPARRIDQRLSGLHPMTQLEIPEEVYSAIWLSPSGRHLYLAELREVKGFTKHWDLVHYDMQMGERTYLIDLGSDRFYYEFDGDRFYKTSAVVKYETGRINCFEGARQVSGGADDLVVESFTMMNGHFIVRIEGSHYAIDSHGKRRALNLGDELYSIPWANWDRRMALLDYRYGSEERHALPSEFHLVEFDEALNVKKTRKVLAGNETKKYQFFTSWTSEEILFAELSDTNQDGKVDYSDERNATIHSLKVETGGIARVMSDRLELRALFGHEAGFFYFVDEVVPKEHSRLSLFDVRDKKATTIKELKGGCFRDFTFDRDATMTVFKKVLDTTGNGNFYDWEDRSQVHRLDLLR